MIEFEMTGRVGFSFGLGEIVIGEIEDLLAICQLCLSLKDVCILVQALVCLLLLSLVFFLISQIAISILPALVLPCNNCFCYLLSLTSLIVDPIAISNNEYVTRVGTNCKVETIHPKHLCLD